MKTVIVNKAYRKILETIEPSTLLNSYFGGSNLTADYLNDFSQGSIDEFIGEWLDNNLNKPWMVHENIYAFEVINDPCIIFRYASCELVNALSCICHKNSQYIETIFKDSKKFFNTIGDFYIFVNPWSNACANWYVIRASKGSEALQDLITCFEDDFIVENGDQNEDTLLNDNGNHVNTDSLRLIGCIKVSE